MSESRKSRRFARNRRRRRFTALVVLVVLVVATPLVLQTLQVKTGPLALGGRVFSELHAVSSRALQSSQPSRASGPSGSVTGASDGGTASSARVNASQTSAGDGKGSSEPPLEQPSPAAAAYAAVAPALPGVKPSSVGGTFQSTDDPSWAVTEVEAPNRDGFYTVYSKKHGGKWEAEQSVLPNTPDYPRKGRAPLVDLPQDLKDALYPETTAGPAVTPESEARKLAADSPYLGKGWKPVSLRGRKDFAKVRMRKKDSGKHTYAYLQRNESSWSVAGIGLGLTAAELPEFPKDLVVSGSLPDAGPAMIPVSKPVLDGVSKDRRKAVESGMKDVRGIAQDYGGIVGVHVQSLDGNWSYGIRPDERFYTASVIKIPIMAAVYRKIEAGDLSLSQKVATKKRDYAGGAGSLQWQDPGTSHTVEDYLWFMITNSDNVAANVLVRTVGGPGYVNEVARDLGADHTQLQQKLSDQRAAAPGLDNYTTPRDMASILDSIASGKAAKGENTDQMLGLMRQNGPESWVGGDLPPEAKPACKVGWIGGVYNDVCLVQSDKGPYIISVFSKYGPLQVTEGASTLSKISEKVWEIQQGKTNPDKKSKNKKG